MSSTNRTNRGGMGADYFITPIPTVETFLKAFAQDDHEGRFALACDQKAWHKIKKKQIQIFDPAAGGDEYNPPSYPAALANHDAIPSAYPRAFWPTYVITTMDIREDSRAMLKGDYLTHEFSEAVRPDVIMTNPPFGLAQQFICKALKDVKKGGLVVMLLRLNYFGSQGRLNFWNTTMPFATYIHAQRPSFWPEKPSQGMLKWCEDNDVEVKRHGATDSVEYMHCVWQAGWEPRHTLARVI